MSYIDSRFEPDPFPDQDPFPSFDYANLRYRKGNLRRMTIAALSSHALDLAIATLFWIYVVYSMV